VALEWVCFLMVRFLPVSHHSALSHIQSYIVRGMENVSLKANSHIACRAHAVPLPFRAVNSHMPCRAPALLRKCRVLGESPRGSRTFPNC